MNPLEGILIDTGIITIICAITKGITKLNVWQKLPAKWQGIIIIIPVLLGIGASLLFTTDYSDWRQLIKNMLFYGYAAAYNWKIGKTGKEIVSGNSGA